MRRVLSDLGKWELSRLVQRLPLFTLLASLILCSQLTACAAAISPAALAMGCPIAATLLDNPAANLTLSLGSSKTMYIMPLGSLTDRLAAIASAATLARSNNVDLKVVWPDGGDADFAAAWEDLFQAPVLPTGPFPSGRFSHADPGCTARRIKTHQDYLTASKKYEKLDNGAYALCLVSSGLFVADPKETSWFYPLLRPSPSVMALIEPFVAEHFWDAWGQWVGIHACRSQECVQAAATAGKALPQTADYLALARQFAEMPLDGESVPRFFIVSEDEAEEQTLLKEIWEMNLTGAKGAGLIFPTRYRRKQPHSVAGLRETVAQLYLMSRTSLVIGTEGSGFSTASAAAGPRYLVFAEVGVAQKMGSSQELDSVRAALVGPHAGVAAGQVAAQSRHMAG